MIQKFKDRISDIDWKYYGFCALILLGLLVVGLIHYIIFIKPVEDRVNAEWQEKYDEMVGKYEDEICDIKHEHAYEIEEIERNYENLIDDVRDEYNSTIDALYDDLQQMENDWSESLRRAEAKYEDDLNALSMEYDAVVDEAYNAGYEDGYTAGKSGK